MTFTVEPWMIYVAAAFLVGLLVGVMLGRRANPTVMEIKRLETDLAKERERRTSYQDQVTRHFSHTADLFESLTDHYKSVYQHLADGCQDLCGDRAPRLNMEVPIQRLTPHRAGTTLDPTPPSENPPVPTQSASGPAVVYITGGVPGANSHPRPPLRTPPPVAASGVDEDPHERPLS